MFPKDWDYIVDTDEQNILAFVRPAIASGKWGVYDMLDVDPMAVEITCNTLEEAKAVAEAIVAMK